MNLQAFIKKHWSNILFFTAIVLLLHPTSKEFILRTIAFSPSESSKLQRIENYHWSLEGLNADDLEFVDLKGKVIFVNFWATWCPPCRAELPMIQELYNDYKNKVVFVFLTNESEQEVATFFQKYGYDLPVYNIKTKIPNALAKTNSIPATYIVDKAGQIRVEEVGAVDWNSAKTRALIDKLLSE